MAFLEGYLIGLSMVIFIGPVFFTLLKGTLQAGFWAGMSVAWGIFISDVVCVSLCAFGAIPFFKNPGNQHWLAAAASILLFALGLRYIFRPAQFTDDAAGLAAKRYSSFFAKGFIVNFVNPFVFIVWIGVIGYAQAKYGFTAELAVFLAASLLGILTTDSLKVIFAHRIKNLLQPVALTRVYKIIGIVLLGFGARMLWFLFSH